MPRRRDGRVDVPTLIPEKADHLGVRLAAWSETGQTAGPGVEIDRRRRERLFEADLSRSRLVARDECDSRRWWSRFAVGLVRRTSPVQYEREAATADDGPIAFRVPGADGAAAGRDRVLRVAGPRPPCAA